MRKLAVAIFLIILLVSGGVIVFHFYEEHTMEASSALARYMLQSLPKRTHEQPHTHDLHSPNLHTREPSRGTSPMDFAAIRNHFGNDDIVAHLLIEGTSIDYLVVQGEDNAFYVTHDIWRRPAASGWIFLDYEADISSLNHNWVIYGHNMQRDHKFHSIRRYASYDFFRDNSLITLTTEAGVYTWQIFSFYSTPMTFSYNTVNFVNRETWTHMLDYFIQKSRHNAGITVTPDDRILTLSTCTNRDINERYVLHAKLVV